MIDMRRTQDFSTNACNKFFKKSVVEEPNFSATILVFDRADLCAILLSGSLDTHVVPRLREAAKAATAGKKCNYVVDLDGVTYISSTGLGFLMYLLKQQREFVFLSNPRPAVLKPFNLFDIKSLFRYYQTVADLGTQPGLTDEVISAIRGQKGSLRATGPHKRGLATLAEYLENEEEVQRMAPYIHGAGQQGRITLPAEEKYAGVLYLFLEKAFGQAGELLGEPIDEAAIELISKELMTNAAKHGYGHQKGGMVEVGYAVDTAKIEVSFADRGRGYSPGAPAEDGLPSAGLAMLRGIFDELTIAPGPEGRSEGLVLGGGTTVRMVKRVKPKAGP